MGGGDDDEDVKEIRELLTARLGNGVKAMKGRSGSISGPTSVRGVPKSQIQLRRYLQGEMSPMMSPPTSDESREGYSPMLSPLGSPKESGGGMLNLINAAQVEEMYARRAVPRRDSVNSAATLTSRDNAGVPVSPAKAKASSADAKLTTELGPRPSKSKLLSKLSDLFKSKDSSPSSSPSNKGEIHTQLERHGSTVGPELSEALLRVSVLAESQKMSKLHMSGNGDDSGNNNNNNNNNNSRRGSKSSTNWTKKAGPREARSASVGEFDDSVVDDSSGTANSARSKEDRKREK